MSDDPKRVITPIARLSYPHLFRPQQAMNEGDTPKYGCELIFEPNADLTALKKAAEQAAADKWGKDRPKKLRSPFRSGDDDREDKDGYEGRIFIGCRSADKPGVVIGPHREIPTNESDVYGGCWVKASVTAFAYSNKGNAGVSFALNNVWKIRDGEPFGNRRSAEDDFSGEEVDSEAFGETSDSLI